MKIISQGILLSLLAISSPTNAKPEALDIDQKQKKVSDKYIRSAHQEISHSLSIEQVRFKILQATLDDKKGKWLMEEDTEGSIIVRFDNNHDVLYANIEYNEQYVQLKYVERPSDFKCLNNQNGICYKNQNSDFYEHLKRLRSNISSSITNSGI